jgi:hypothetical protein
MVENFFYTEGAEKEELLKERLNEKDSLVETPKGTNKKVHVPIKRRIVMTQQNYSKKAFVLEELEIPEIMEELIPGYSKISIELRFGYYIIDKNGNWAWGQFAPFIPKDDLNNLMEKAKEKGFV